MTDEACIVSAPSVQQVVPNLCIYAFEDLIVLYRSPILDIGIVITLLSRSS